MFFTTKNKNKIELENKLKFLHIIKFNILLYKYPKYEIILLTFGLKSSVKKYVITTFKQ